MVKDAAIQRLFEHFGYICMGSHTRHTVGDVVSIDNRYSVVVVGDGSIEEASAQRVAEGYKPMTHSTHSYYYRVIAE